MLNVVLAEDHNIVRNGIRMLLEMDKHINVIGEATNGLEVLEMVSEGKKIDIVIADINMPEMDGLELIQKLQIQSMETKVVMLSMLDNEKYVARAFSEGASGYLLKNVSADELLFSVKHIHAGGKYLCAELSIRLLDKLLQNPAAQISRSNINVEFSMREIEVLQMIAEGLTNNEISDKLFISKRTIEGYRQSLIERAGVKNTASLIKYAVLNGLIS
ncbi:MAG: response regulator transcription factor [Bacteroidota bacterium]